MHYLINGLFRPVSLPPYSLISSYENKGNWAVSKYYKFPFNIFYTQKLRMMVDMMRKNYIYRCALDFGTGSGIFKLELRKHALIVVGVNREDELVSKKKFELITCGSVLEFCNLETTLDILNNSLEDNGELIIASPMYTWMTRLYFNLIGDKNSRHSHLEILKKVSNIFRVVQYKQWNELYFTLKAVHK